MFKVELIEDNKKFKTACYYFKNDIIIISLNKFFNDIEVYYNINGEFLPLKYGESQPYTVKAPFKTFKDAVNYFIKYCS